MKPPYDINNDILNLIASISEKIGEVNAAHLHKPSPELRKLNRVKTIRASLAIEGNSLSEEQVTAIIDNKRVLGPKKDIVEVLNAMEVYEKVREFKPDSLDSFLEAHAILMEGLVEQTGQLRTKSVGIFKGTKVTHLAPPPGNLHHLMSELFKYIRISDDHPLIKSCVTHYEIEFIHPFIDGNGRMGRLWQTLVLLQSYPIFEFLPFETLIKSRQQEYYEVLEHCDRSGKSTRFIEFSLDIINASLEDLLGYQNRTMTTEQRIEYFIDMTDKDRFSRKDYLDVFKDISTATASRDLKYAVENELINKVGDKRTAYYLILK